MSPEELEALCLELAERIRGAVAGLYTEAWRTHIRTSASGDVTFAVDERAEAELASFVAAAPIPLAVYSEDRGLWGDAAADWLLVVDPVDGTRPALANFEAACVAVALARNRPAATLADVEVGVVIEIKSGARTWARRGAGARSDLPLAPARTTDLSRLFWASGFRGRPARLLADLLADLIDTSSVGGGFFDLGSASFILTRLATGQLDAYVDPGVRLVREVPGAEAEFRRVGDGRILCNQPYDIAAAALVLHELGLPVTDAWGRSVGQLPLLADGDAALVSTVAATSPDLHAQLLAALEVSFARLRG